MNPTSQTGAAVSAQNLRRGRVALDGLDGTFECLVETNTWNGFARPWFTRHEARLIQLALTDARGMGEDTTTFLDDDGFAVEHDGAREDFAACEFAGHGLLYPIGAGGWCWSLVAVDDATLAKELKRLAEGTDLDEAVAGLLVLLAITSGDEAGVFFSGPVRVNGEEIKDHATAWPRISRLARECLLREFAEFTKASRRTDAAAQPNEGTAITLNQRELATVLAALRMWQKLPCDALMFEDIASDAGAVKPLNESEVDKLCEKLNAPAEVRTPPATLVRDALKLAIRRAEDELMLWPVKELGNAQHLSLRTYLGKLQAALVAAGGAS